MLSEAARYLDDDYSLLLYNMFVKFYFLRELIPVLTNHSSCEDSSCEGWIIWTPWKETKKVDYFFPALDGSSQYELHRLRRFLTLPNPNLCNLRQGFGGRSYSDAFVDGMYTVCLDKLRNPGKNSCTVYSFVISDDWSFDDALHKFGCEVYSFDPFINRSAYQRGKNHWFYPWGIGNENSLNKSLLSSSKIKKNLNHIEKTITILKLDVEGSEWEFFDSENIADELKTVDQLIVEVHPVFSSLKPFEPVGQEKALHLLEKLGFSLFFSRLNPSYPSARVGIAPDQSMYFYELSFLKTSH